MDMRGTSNMYFFTQISSMMPEDTNCVSLMVKTAIAKAGEAAAARGPKAVTFLSRQSDSTSNCETILSTDLDHFNSWPSFQNFIFSYAIIERLLI